jgi:class 3 adenylate cyclase
VLVDDLLAVVEAAQGEPPALFSNDEGFISLLAAAAHPDRFRALVLYGASPSYVQSEEVPWQWSEDRWEAFLGQLRRSPSLREWTEQWMRRQFPSLRGDHVAFEWLVDMSHLTCTQNAWVTSLGQMSKVDLRSVLPSIRMPTLVLHRTEDPGEPVESGRYLAEHIAGARLVELPGRDAQPWLGDPEAVLAEIEEFLVGVRTPPEPTRALATVLFTDIVGSTERAAALGDRAWSIELEGHRERVRRAIMGHRGREIDNAGDGFLATFDGPARAVTCASEIIATERSHGLDVRAGLHAGEVELDASAVQGIAVHIGARVASLAAPTEILVSSTVRDLTVGSGIVYEDRGERELKGVPDRWRLFAVVEA